MPPAKIALLQDRGVVSVTGADAAKLLQGLITNDVDAIADGGAIFAGLLSPQGKILFDFFVVKAGDAYLIDVARDKAGDLVKRLTMYKLRADAAIADLSNRYAVIAGWGGNGPAKSFADPRTAELGWRLLSEREPEGDLAPATAYHARRISVGVPEGGKDYDFGDAFPHEADLDLFNGVSFTKGCYVGQEVVARMQNKSVVRKRVVRITGEAPLTSGAGILLGDVPIGRIGTAAGAAALAMLRLDRAIEAQEKSSPLTAGGVVVTPETEALDRYRASAAARPAASGLPS